MDGDEFAEKKIQTLQKQNAHTHTKINEPD